MYNCVVGQNEIHMILTLFDFQLSRLSLPEF